jgi:hypothetical protein
MADQDSKLSDVEPVEEPISEPDDDIAIQDVDPETEVVSTSYEITSYGADYDVDGLVRRMRKGDIVVPSFDPEFVGTGEVRAFQRSFVWRQTQMSRFVESLLLGLPVPGIFLVRDRDNRLLVLDGQQRLRTLDMFYSGTIGERKFRLTNVQEPWSGLTYEQLEPEDRRRLDDSIIHATVLRQETAAGSQNAIYSIYERLNTGGSPLQPQEIRIALFAGRFLNGLTALNADEHWRNLYGPISPRYRDHELILRVLALHGSGDEYVRPLKTFLNDYLARNQDQDVGPDSDLGSLFLRAIEFINGALGKPAFRPERAVNAAYVDSVTVGVMQRMLTNPSPEAKKFVAAFKRLTKMQEFRLATLYNTSSEEAVEARLRLARETFAEI